MEKTCILLSEDVNLLNKRSEIMKKCRHREKFLITRPEEELTREELYELSFQEKNLSKTISIILNVKQFLPYYSVKSVKSL